MNNIAELQTLRETSRKKMGLDGGSERGIRVVVGLATCGIAAGARPVLDALTREVERRSLANVSVVQTGCIGICQYEPVVEVYEPGKEKITYVKVTPEMAADIVSGHLVGGAPVTKYTIGYGAEITD